MTKTSQHVVGGGGGLRRRLRVVHPGHHVEARGEVRQGQHAHAQPALDLVQRRLLGDGQLGGQAGVQPADLRQVARLQALQQPGLRGLAALFRQQVEGVEERVQRRVEGQHKDGHAHVDVGGDGGAGEGQQAQQADGEPAEEVGQDDGSEAAGDGGVPAGLLLHLGHGVGPDGAVDEGLAHRDQQEEHQVQHDQHAEGVGVAPELLLAGEGQRDADAGLAVEPPVGRHGQQRDDGQGESGQPRDPTSHQGRLLPEVDLAEGEAQDEEAVERNEADQEGRDLGREQREETGAATRHALLPRLPVPQVLPAVHPVRHPDHRQVHPHQKVRHAQVGHQDVEAALERLALQVEPGHEAARVAHHGQQSEGPKEHAVHVQAEQVLARSDVVGRGVAAVRFEVVREGRLAAQLEVVGEDFPERRERLEHVDGVGLQRVASQVQDLQVRRRSEAFWRDARQRRVRQVQLFEVTKVREDGAVECRDVRARKVQTFEACVDRLGRCIGHHLHQRVPGQNEDPQVLHGQKGLQLHN